MVATFRRAEGMSLLSAMLYRRVSGKMIRPNIKLYSKSVITILFDPTYLRDSSKDEMKSSSPRR